MASPPVQLLKSVDNSECSFCYVKIPDGQGVILNKCLHTFCRTCLVMAIELSEVPQIKCPVHDEFICGGYLLDAEIKLLVSAEIYQKYFSKSLAVATKVDDQLVHYCQVKDCPGLYILEEGVINFECQVCLQNNCTKCKGFHEIQIACSRGVKRKREMQAAEEAAQRQKQKLEDEAKVNAELAVDWSARWEQMKKLVQSQSIPSTGEPDIETAWVDLLQTDLFIPNEPFECAICLVQVSAGEGIILQECFHAFCRDCLQSTVEHCEEPQVKCPFQGAHTPCHSVIQEREIKSIYDKYLSRSLAKAEINTSSAFHCKSVSCPGWCEVEGDDALNFPCSYCKKVNCIKCQTIHEAVSCEEYMRSLHKDDDEASQKALNHLISSGKAMRCPTCKVIIIKNGGCDGIQCRICKTMLCWATRGPRWGPKGLGDTSGGCNCRVNGKKCHPLCCGCH